MAERLAKAQAAQLKRKLAAKKAAQEKAAQEKAAQEKAAAASSSKGSKAKAGGGGKAVAAAVLGGKAQRGPNSKRKRAPSHGGPARAAGAARPLLTGAALTPPARRHDAGGTAAEPSSRERGEPYLEKLPDLFPEPSLNLPCTFPAGEPYLEKLRGAAARLGAARGDLEGWAVEVQVHPGGPCTFPVPSLYLPCTFPEPSLSRCRTTRAAERRCTTTPRRKVQGRFRERRCTTTPRSARAASARKPMPCDTWALRPSPAPRRDHGRRRRSRGRPRRRRRHRRRRRPRCILQRRPPLSPPRSSHSIRWAQRRPSTPSWTPSHHASHLHLHSPRSLLFSSYSVGIGIPSA